ncbi:hypothetical protein [Deinococcus sonorensis]|uniref:Uncharacterized protein n=2 Tax=Deinococcus sonorensis TaxID=309891 RepID=A0AAU7UC15_9DEIO
MKSPLLCLAVLTALPTAGAATPLLRPVPLTPACQKAGYTVLQDSAGHARVLRYVRLTPDNTLRLTQYYDASGRLLSLKASANGFVGQLYTLTARLDGRGRIVSETGYRAKFDHTDLKTLIRDVAAVKAGQCP